MTIKVMELIDTNEGILKCKVCGQRASPIKKEGGVFPRGSWNCINGCKLEVINKKEV